MQARIRDAAARWLPEAESFLCSILQYPSISGQEHELMLFLERVFTSPALQVARAPMSNDILRDPDYCTPVPGIQYDGRFNLRLRRAGTGGGRTLLFNAHTDVVPPSEGMTQAWIPRVEQGTVFARGACDDKGQIAVFFLVTKILDELGIRLKGDLVAHLVNEEENGGNGSLAMARAGEKADFCIVLEPTENRLLTSIRGAVWFQIRFKGVAGHSGSAGQTRSALLMARDAMVILEKYHADLLKASRGFRLFDSFANPMPITFGKLHAGNWPAAAPNTATLEGVLGFLPNRTKEEICREMRAALVEGGLSGNDFELNFLYRHDSSVLDPDHPAPALLLQSARNAGHPLEVGGMPASCDAWFYNNQLGIPTVVFGAGTLKVAHSVQECIAMADVARAAEVLVNFAVEYCGTSTEK